jgi:peroxiredoxin
MRRIVVLILVLCCTSVAWPMASLNRLAVRTPLVGKAAPDIVLPDSAAGSSGILAPVKGQKAIVIFWATWCPHCYEDLGNLNEQWASIEQKGIKIILVDVGETPRQVSAYFNRRHMKLVSFVDENNLVQDRYFLVGVPTLLFIDEKGIVRNVTHQFPPDYESYFK